MGIEKPYEVERGELGTPPGPPHADSVEQHVRELIHPSHHGVVIAGVELPTPNADPAHRAAELRALVTRRIEERRPNADGRTWRSFADFARDVARDHPEANGELARALVSAVDGL